MNSQDLLDKIKEHARPSYGPALDDYVEQATNNGWTLDTLAAALNKGIGAATNAGYVVVTLKRLATTAPLTPKGNQPNPVRGHIKCTKHPLDNCETCYCDPTTPTHHTGAPMPLGLRALLTQLSNTTNINNIDNELPIAPTKPLQVA